MRQGIWVVAWLLTCDKVSSASGWAYIMSPMCQGGFHHLDRTYHVESKAFLISTTMATQGYALAASAFNAGSQGPQPSSALGPSSFPRPSIGHICAQCRNIPVELLMLGSSFFSKRCKGRHAEGENCKGKHNISCAHCQSPIRDAHHHCHICNEGDFDLCSACKEEGKHCLQGGHKMVKRTFDEQLIREVDETGITKHHPGVTRAMIEKWSVTPYRLHKSFKDLAASADSGCHSCCTLLTRLDGQVDEGHSDTAVYIENRPLFFPPNTRGVMGLFKMMALEPDLDDDADEGLPTAVVAVRSERDPAKPVFWDPDQDVAVEYLPFEIQGGDRLYQSRHVHWGRGNGKPINFCVSTRMLTEDQIADKCRP